VAATWIVTQPVSAWYCGDVFVIDEPDLARQMVDADVLSVSASGETNYSAAIGAWTSQPETLNRFGRRDDRDALIMSQLQQMWVA
jgi:hypothetical protein